MASLDTEDVLGFGAAGAVVGASFNAVDKATGSLIPGLSGVAGAISAASEGMLRFGGVTEKQINIFKTLADALTKEGGIGTAISTLTKALEKNIDTYQDLNKEIIQLGRGDGTKAFIESIRVQALEVSRLGISMEKLMEANKALLKETQSSVIIDKEQAKSFESRRSSMAELIGFNKKFGISEQESAEFLNAFNNTMKEGKVISGEFSDSLLIFSQKTGQEAKNVFGQFTENIERFAFSSGKDAIKTFEQLQLTATRTGQAFGKVVGAIEKFDDIETGFESGGRLNRVLSFMGGSFDTFKAMQATDEERNKMLYDSIAGVADRFQGLQTTQAKRGFAKQLAESTGIDLKTVIGVLEKTTDMSADLQKISVKDPIMGTFTEKGREDAAAALTTSKDWAEVIDQLIDHGPIIAELSRNMQNHSRNATELNANIVTALEPIQASIVTAKNAGEFVGIAKDFVTKLGTIPELITKMATEKQEKQQKSLDSVIATYESPAKLLTDEVKEFGRIIKNGIETRIIVSYEGGQQKGQPSVKTTVATAIAGLPWNIGSHF